MDSKGSPLHAHERARRLMAMSRVEGISDAERLWLDAHLQDCASCAYEDAAMTAAIEALRAAPAPADPGLVSRARFAVRRRSAELRGEQARAFPLWVSVAVSTAWLIVTLPVSWWAFGWMAELLRVPDPMWQAGFLVWWFLPGTIVAAIMAWRQSADIPRDFPWSVETIGGHR